MIINSKKDFLINPTKIISFFYLDKSEDIFLYSNSKDYSHPTIKVYSSIPNEKDTICEKEIVVKLINKEGKLAPNENTLDINEYQHITNKIFKGDILEITCIYKKKKYFLKLQVIRIGLSKKDPNFYIVKLKPLNQNITDFNYVKLPKPNRSTNIVTKRFSLRNNIINKENIIDNKKANELSIFPRSFMINEKISNKPYSWDDLKNLILNVYETTLPLYIRNDIVLDMTSSLFIEEVLDSENRKYYSLTFRTAFYERTDNFREFDDLSFVSAPKFIDISYSKSISDFFSFILKLGKRQDFGLNVFASYRLSREEIENVSRVG